jgi:hypothetical protein
MTLGDNFIEYDIINSNTLTIYKEIKAHFMKIRRAHIVYKKANKEYITELISLE